MYIARSPDIWNRTRLSTLPFNTYGCHQRLTFIYQHYHLQGFEHWSIWMGGVASPTHIGIAFVATFDTIPCGLRIFTAYGFYRKLAQIIGLEPIHRFIGYWLFSKQLPCQLGLYLQNRNGRIRPTVYKTGALTNCATFRYRANLFSPGTTHINRKDWTLWKVQWLQQDLNLFLQMCALCAFRYTMQPCLHTFQCGMQAHNKRCKNRDATHAICPMANPYTTFDRYVGHIFYNKEK